MKRLLTAAGIPSTRLLLLTALMSALAPGLRASALEDESSRAPSLAQLAPSEAERDARLGWWREARFGMFVHWGVYSGLAGTWKGQTYGGYAEHIQRHFKIPCAVYRQEVAGQFNPTEFNAEEWAGLAKQAGMGYFVITAKHHDGFAMFDSQVSDYNIVKATPFARDPMKALRAACKKAGIRFGFYYSQAFDWGEENGAGNDWDYANPGGDRLLHGADWWKTYPEFLPQARKYVDEKAIPQILELIRNYDPDILWFDTPHKLPVAENMRILAAIRRAKPSLVVNGRLVSGGGDYDNTCDRPAEFPPHDGDWEAIPTTNESYGYNENDHSHKPVAHFIQLLAKSAARGGNELLNIGPMGNGKISPPDIRILQGIGDWWRVNGESIRGTTRTPLTVQAWGESTRKGNRLYLHVFDWPADGRLTVGGLKTGVQKAWLLAAPDAPLNRRREGLELSVSVPAVASSAMDSVVVLECDGAPEGDDHRLLLPVAGTQRLRGLDAQLHGKTIAYGPGKTRDAYVMNWSNPAESVSWPVRLNQKATFEVALIYDAPKEMADGKVVEGDAGLERKHTSAGAAGDYVLVIGQQKLNATVRQGSGVTETLGTMTLEPGRYEMTLAAKAITGQELMRLRELILKPISP